MSNFCEIRTNLVLGFEGLETQFKPGEIVMYLLETLHFQKIKKIGEETPFVNVIRANTNVANVPLCILDLSDSQKKEIASQYEGVVFD